MSEDTTNSVDRDQILEKEVYDKVILELETLGANTKENFEEIQKNYKSLKEEMESNLVDNSKVEKLKEDILTRQQKLDEANIEIKEKEKETQKRIDEVELLLKRAKPQNTQIDKELKEVLKNHTINCATVSGKRFLDKDFIKEDFEKYENAFKTYICKGESLLSSENQKSLSVGIDPHGGYTVMPAMSSSITTKLYESDPIRQLARTENISSDAWEELVDWDQFGYGWENETETGSETSTGDLKKKRIPVHIMYAKPRATQQLLEDSGINIENWIANKVSDRFSRAEGAAFVTGDGVGKPRGFTTYSNGTTWGTVQQVNMGAAAAITADGFIKVKYALIEQYLNRGTWLMNRTTVRDTMLLKDGTGNYIWKPALSVDGQETILSLPVRMSTSMPTIAANSLSVVLADWKEAYVIVDRLGISVQRDPYTAKPFVEFYTRKRVGGDIINFDAIKIGKIAA